MTAQPIERVDLDAIVELDFDVTPPCESIYHGRFARVHAGPAYALVRIDACIFCGDPAITAYRCRRWTDLATMLGFCCSECERDNPPSSVHILALVGGAS